MSDKVAVPTPKVGAEELATALDVPSAAVSGSLDFSIWGMFWDADIVVKLVIFILLAASFWCWAIIFEKLITVRNIRQKIGGFEKSFWSGELLEELYERIKNTADHPMALVFVAAMQEWKMQDLSKRNDKELKVGLKERIFQAMYLVRNQEMDKLERNTSFLATVGSTAPFVGLFGTVWGIMNSFAAIAAMQNITLVTVAPGIAEALFATAIGLFAAIPAVIFYNKFTNDMNAISSKLDDFSSEFGAILSRELDRY
jgi:biopolymer transport protein TolQ